MTNKKTAKSNSKKLDDINHAINKLLKERDSLETKEIRKVHIPYLKSLVGKCFVYRNNSYGINSDHWNVYRRILGYKYDGKQDFSFVIEQFSIDCYGSAAFSAFSDGAYLGRAWFGTIPFSGYEEVDENEYFKERSRTIDEMFNPKLCLENNN